MLMLLLLLTQLQSALLGKIAGFLRIEGRQMALWASGFQPPSSFKRRH
jgi:hypothetical protein